MMLATGWWLQPEVWLVSQLAMWSFILLTAQTRKAAQEQARKEANKRKRY